MKNLTARQTRQLHNTAQVFLGYVPEGKTNLELLDRLNKAIDLEASEAVTNYLFRNNRNG